jgi:probable HAF family extracellular repeat protein
VFWEEGAAIDLGNLGGTFFFEATAINNETQVVGFSDLPGDTMFHAFLWQDGLMHDLGALSGDSVSFASAINNRSQIVGTSCLDAFFTNCGAFLWQNGTMLDLNNLISGSNLFLVQAIGINDRGQIAGFTADFHAFLATPRNGDTAGESAKPATQRKNVVLPENVRKMLRLRVGRYHTGGWPSPPRG